MFSSHMCPTSKSDPQTQPVFAWLLDIPVNRHQKRQGKEPIMLSQGVACLQSRHRLAPVSV